MNLFTKRKPELTMVDFGLRFFFKWLILNCKTEGKYEKN